MSAALVTGSMGLVGAEAVGFFAQQGMDVVGIDNDMRADYFGPLSSNINNLKRMQSSIPNYSHHNTDVRSRDELEAIFKDHGSSISLILHAAAQPSHDWAGRHPETDFSVNAVGTMNLLELARQHCPEAVFVFVSTNKVYGDRPNGLPFVEQNSRWEVDPSHGYAAHGIDEGMSIDGSTHSLFGVSKTAADLMVQEYGRYFGMKTACFRCGCITGPGHAGAQLHGFLSYMARCAVNRTPYTVFGHDGKQVRDNIHSLDLVRAFWSFYRSPGSGEVYNMGGGRDANCSIIEAMEMCERLTGLPFDAQFGGAERKGDHVWWISDTRKFRAAHPDWVPEYGIERLMEELLAGEKESAIIG